MRRILMIVLVSVSFGTCSAAFALSPDYCRELAAACTKDCSTDQCVDGCQDGFEFCLLFAHQGKKPTFRGAATTVGPFSAPAMTPGVKNVNPGTAATTTANIGTVGTKTVNPGAATTTPTGVATLSTSAKPQTAFSNGTSRGAPVVQPGRNNLRVQ